MTISSELLMAILSMDSYNRGYNPGISDGEHVENDVDLGLGDAVDTLVGNARIISRVSSDPNGEAQAAGFYAIAYKLDAAVGDLAANTTIISYRGTDSPWSEVPLVDLPIWSGDYDEPQLYLASQFYRSVAATATGPLTLTGHSLGGALAGFTAALYNQDAVIVDPIGFVEAFNNFRANYANYQGLLSIPENERNDAENDFITVYENTIGQFGFDPATFPVPDSPNDNDDYKAFHLEGSVAAQVRDETVSHPLALSVPLAGLIGSIDAHSAFLNVIIRFAQEMYASSNWVALADKLLPALFDDDIGKAIDAEHPTWFGSQIAYSALEEGTLVFGNTGIRAMFDDANELGAVVGAGTTTPLLDTFVPGIANIIVQFAGMMAKNKVDYGNVAGNSFHPEDGIVSLIDANGNAVSNAASATYLTVDLNQDHWKTGNTDPEPGDVDVVGINTMLDKLWLQENGNPDEFIVIPGQLTPPAENSILPILWSLYRHDQGLSDFSAGTLINSATFSLPGAPSDVLLQHSNVPDEGRYVSLFSGTSNSEVITGSKSDESVLSGVADEIVFAGGGDDTVDGGMGSDVLIGGEGIDILIGGHGDDVLIGGNGDDVIYDGEQWDAQGNVPDSSSIFLDESRDYISAGNGNDKVYSGKGTDIISLGDGSDEVHLVQPEPDPNANPNMPDVATQAIIWGGDGIDKFYFSGDVHILSVTVQDMNEALLTGLSSEALFKAYNDGQEWPYDYIIVNLESQDEIYLNDVKIGSANVVVNEYEHVSGPNYEYEYYYTGDDYTGNSSTGEWDYYQAARIVTNVNTNRDDYFEIEGFEGEGNTRINYNYDDPDKAMLSVQDNSGGYIALDGFVDGVAGIHLNGDGIQYRTETETTVQQIDPDNAGSGTLDIIYHNWDGTAYIVPQSYTDIGEPEVTNTVPQEGYNLKPSNYAGLSAHTLDLASFQYVEELGTDGDDEFLADEKPSIFNGGQGRDAVDYSGSDGPVEIYLSSRGSSGNAAGHRYSSIEDVKGTAYADRIFGDLAGNTLTGNGGNDYLNGSWGDDTLLGGDGNDELEGGLGDDILNGGDGTEDVAGYFADPSDLQFTLNSDGSVNALSSEYGFDTLIGIEKVRFYTDGSLHNLADLVTTGPILLAGTAGDDYLAGTSANDEISGLAGDDHLDGLDGDDILLGGDGNDTLNGGAGDDVLAGGGGTYNQVDYEGVRTDFSFVRNLDTSVTVTSAAWGTDTLTDINGVWFVGEAKWYDLDDLIDYNGFDTIDVGTSGDDYLTGTAGNDAILGGEGDDTLYGGAGGDLLDGQGGAYNQVDYDGAASDYTFTRNADNSITVSHATYGTDTLKNIDGVWFYGESAWYDLGTLAPDPNTYVGTGNSGYFGGTTGDDTIIFTGGTGNYVSADAGNDIIVFSGNVADYNILGQGDHFTIENAAGTDAIQFTEVEYISFGDTGPVSLADIVANSTYSPGDTWFDPEPIGGLI